MAIGCFQCWQLLAIQVTESAVPNPPLKYPKFRLDNLNRARPHFASAALSSKTTGDFGLGYFTDDKGLMAGRIVIPTHNVKCEVVAYAGRWPGIPPYGTPKYKLTTEFRKSWPFKLPLSTESI